MILSSMSSASARGRWKVLRPMIEPLAPPSRRPRISVNSLYLLFCSDEEKSYMLCLFKFSFLL